MDILLYNNDNRLVETLIDEEIEMDNEGMVVETEKGSIVVRATDKGIDCDGDACDQLCWTVKNKQVIITNRSTDRINVLLKFGFLNCGGPFVTEHLSGGEQKEVDFPGGGTNWFCGIEANYS